MNKDDKLKDFNKNSSELMIKLSFFRWEVTTTMEVIVRKRQPKI